MHSANLHEISYLVDIRRQEESPTNGISHARYQGSIERINEYSRAKKLNAIPLLLHKTGETGNKIENDMGIQKSAHYPWEPENEIEWNRRNTT